MGHLARPLLGTGSVGLMSPEFWTDPFTVWAIRCFTIALGGGLTYVIVGVIL